jgi:hypothetical protein
MKTIRLNSNEVWPLVNILNEVCSGIHIDNFEKCIGVKKEVVVELMDKVMKEELKDEPILKLNDYEIEILERSFNEVFKQIEEWEFQTRIGIKIQEAQRIKNKL